MHNINSSTQQNIKIGKLSFQATHVKWVFMASSVAVLGTEHTNKEFLDCGQGQNDRYQVPAQVSINSSKIHTGIKNHDKGTFHIYRLSRDI